MQCGLTNLLQKSKGYNFMPQSEEWCGYPMVNKIEDMMITRFDRKYTKIHESDRQEDRRADRHRVIARWHMPGL